MAQIKNIKKPGDLIRGAKVGVAGLDKDGNVIGSGIDVEDIATWPEGAQSGDVLTWGGETGPEWEPPSGVSPSYIMAITINSNTMTAFRIRGTVIVSSDTPFTIGTISYADFKSKILKVTTTPNYIVVSNFFGITVNTSGDNAPFEACSFIRLKNDNEVVFTTSSAELTYDLTNSTIRINAIFEL